MKIVEHLFLEMSKKLYLMVILLELLQLQQKMDQLIFILLML